MTPQRWQQIKTLLSNALEFKDDAEREAYLAAACGNDADLRQEVDALLEPMPDQLEAFADNLRTTVGRAVSPDPLGHRLGAYEIVREIGRGGMGSVYLAARADGQFEKQVAIKLLRRGTDTDEILRRFQAEREVLARLDHPNIARLIDAGTTDDGLPYFIMEYVDGVPVTLFAKEKCGRLRLCLELFLKIAAAVEAAHSGAVIHRDLKPSNILVNREGEPKLLDFGIAKLLTDDADGYPQTISGQERLTPIFASPEQIEGKGVTRSSDVYSLGVVLYEILTSSPPFRFPTERPTLTQITSAICDQVPIRPSEAV